ncbi:MAG TPA: hypothetical protein GX694_11430 [Actinomycetales bacterium]|nr:hypothetical protein [Actinomycetales bacterium]
MNPLRAYRSTGADLPFGDPRAAHGTATSGVAMEGYFYRVTDPATGRVVIALIGVNRGPDGPWATLGLASAVADGPSTVATRAVPGAWSDPDRLGARSGDAFVGHDRGVDVDLGPGARLHLEIDEAVEWPHRAFGGSSVFQCVPALNQYWHPWLLGGRGRGWAEVGDERWEFDAAQVYGEKNWGGGGFPESWWWGQAQGFDDPGACLAFAGGQVHSGPLRTEVTALVVRLPDGRVVRLGNPVVSPVRAQVSDDEWLLSGRGYCWRIDVVGRAPLARAHVLPVPLPDEGRNTAGDLEHLTGEVEVTVRRRGRLVWSGRSSQAALEHGGLARAEAELRRRGVPPGATDHAP